VRQRYSAALQQQAIAYWRRRRAQDGVRTITAALGVSPRLQRWWFVACAGDASVCINMPRKALI
jgi:hypothetical protein